MFSTSKLFLEIYSEECHSVFHPVYAFKGYITHVFKLKRINVLKMRFKRLLMREGKNESVWKKSSLLHLRYFSFSSANYFILFRNANFVYFLNGVIRLF